MTDLALEWDYTAQAPFYEHRAPYHAGTLAAAVDLGAPVAGRAVDLGAGTGRFTRMLVTAGFAVDAVEPNAAMRVLGVAHTPAEVRWRAVRAEHTGLPGAAFDLACFASTFNVVDSTRALDEAARLLRGGGAMLVLWNHRRLDDPLQAAIERVIRRIVPDYTAGRRRDDPAPLIAAHPCFESPRAAVLPLVHTTTTAAFIEGFRAHATLVRQAGSNLPRVLEAIAATVEGHLHLAVPFETRLWVARRHA